MGPQGTIRGRPTVRKACQGLAAESCLSAPACCACCGSCESVTASGNLQVGAEAILGHWHIEDFAVRPQCSDWASVGSEPRGELEGDASRSAEQNSNHCQAAGIELKMLCLQDCLLLKTCRLGKLARAAELLLLLVSGTSGV